MPHWSNSEGPLSGPWGVLPACHCFLGLRVLRPAPSSVGVGQPCGSLAPCVSAVSQHVCVCARTHRCAVESCACCLVTAPHPYYSPVAPMLSILVTSEARA